MINFKSALEKLAVLKKILENDKAFAVIDLQIKATEEMTEEAGPEMQDATDIPEVSSKAEQLDKAITDFLLHLEFLVSEIEKTKTEEAKPDIMRAVEKFNAEYAAFKEAAGLLIDTVFPDMANLSTEVEQGFAYSLRLQDLPKPPPSPDTQRAQEKQKKLQEAKESREKEHKERINKLKKRKAEFSKSILILAKHIDRESDFGRYHVANLTKANGLYQTAIIDFTTLLENKGQEQVIDPKQIADAIQEAEKLFAETELFLKPAEVNSTIAAMESRRKEITEATKTAFIGHKTDPFSMMARVAAINEASALYAQAIGAYNALLQGGQMALAVDITRIQASIAYAEGLIENIVPNKPEINLSAAASLKEKALEELKEPVDIDKTKEAIRLVEENLQSKLVELRSDFNSFSKYNVVEDARKNLLELYYSPKKYMHHGHELFSILFKAVEYKFLPFLAREDVPNKDEMRGFNGKLLKFIELLEPLKEFSKQSSERAAITTTCDEIKRLAKGVTNKLELPLLSNADMTSVWKDKADLHTSLAEVFKKLSSISDHMSQLDGHNSESTKEWNAVHQPLQDLEFLLMGNKLSNESSVPIYNLVQTERLLAQIVTAAKTKHELPKEFTKTATTLLNDVNTTLDNLASTNGIVSETMSELRAKYNPDYKAPTMRPRAGTFSGLPASFARRFSSVPASDEQPKTESKQRHFGTISFARSSKAKVAEGSAQSEAGTSHARERSNTMTKNLKNMFKRENKPSNSRESESTEQQPQLQSPKERSRSPSPEPS